MFWRMWHMCVSVSVCVESIRASPDESFIGCEQAACVRVYSLARCLLTALYFVGVMFDSANNSRTHLPNMCLYTAASAIGIGHDVDGIIHNFSFLVNYYDYRRSFLFVSFIITIAPWRMQWTRQMHTFSS